MATKETIIAMNQYFRCPQCLQVSEFRNGTEPKQCNECANKPLWVRRDDANHELWLCSRVSGTRRIDTMGLSRRLAIQEARLR